MGALDVGAAATDRTYIVPAGSTILALDNPATAAFIVNQLQFWWNTRLLVALYVGSFYLVSPSTYKCRDAVELETPIIEGALRKINQNIGHTPIALHFENGDLIGACWLSGYIEEDDTGGSGLLYAGGNHCIVDDVSSYSAYGGDSVRIMSIRGVVLPTSTPGGADIMGLFLPH